MFNADQIVKLLEQRDSNFWMEEAGRHSLQLFRDAAQRVPAYKDFLSKNKINPDKIKTREDFKHVPIIDKKNYLRQYPLESLCWDGSFSSSLIYTSTSGSTGEPIYFFRTKNLDWQYSFIIRNFLEIQPAFRNKPILVINAFSMGVWIGGLITNNAFEIAAKTWGYPISIINTGINIQQITSALKKISPKYERTILAGYPPFVKDVIDEAIHQGVDLKALNIGLIFAAEGFNELFRQYVAENVGMKHVYLGTMNIYGSAELGAMASETPFTILLRSLSLQHESLYTALFDQATRLPTVAQFNPLFVNFESVENELILTGDSAMPLVRYAIGDQGGIVTYNDALTKCSQNEIDVSTHIEVAQIKNQKISELPIVYLYERKDFVISFYGLQVYPEHIREALLLPKFNNFFTGKFFMQTKYDEGQNQFLEIHIEQKLNAAVDVLLKNAVLDAIIFMLKKKNSEFNELYKYLGGRAKPRLVFCPYQQNAFFQPGVKQKWVLSSGQ